MGMPANLRPRSRRACIKIKVGWAPACVRLDARGRMHIPAAETRPLDPVVTRVERRCVRVACSNLYRDPSLSPHLYSVQHHLSFHALLTTPSFARPTAISHQPGDLSVTSSCRARLACISSASSSPGPSTTTSRIPGLLEKSASTSLTNKLHMRRAFRPCSAGSDQLY